MCEVLDDTAAQVIPAIESGDSIRGVAQHHHTPYETFRQAANSLEEDRIRPGQRWPLFNARMIFLEPRPSLNLDHAEGYPVILRRATIEYMRENYAQFQSALAMFDWMNDDLGVTYRETERTQT